VHVLLMLFKFQNRSLSTHNEFFDKTYPLKTSCLEVFCVERRGFSFFKNMKKMLIQNARMYSFQQNTTCELDI
jgi:hypothetical protein